MTKTRFQPQAKKSCRSARAAAVTAAAAIAAAGAIASAAPQARATEVTISLSGSTAMRNFTSSPAISLVEPGTTLTLSNGTFPANVGYWTNGVSFQLAPTQAGAVITTGVSQQADALQLQWHEQGSVEGILDMINDQIGAQPGNAATRDASVANPIWINQNKFTASGSNGGGTESHGGFTLGAFQSGQGQARVQMAISDVNAVQGFSTGATSAAAWNRTPGQAGYGKGNQILAGGGSNNLRSLGLVGSHAELSDASVANIPTGTLANGTTATAGAWNAAGTGNLESHAVAATATLFVANPGTGLDKLNRTDAQWLQTTSSLSNGASFNFTSRDVNSGTRNVAALNTGVDPSWAVGKNDGGTGSAGENALGAGIRFSNKTAGGNLRTTVQNARMAVGTLGLSDAVSFTNPGSSAPIRGLDYSDSADGSSPYVRASANSITDGSYVIWQNETYVTVKAPDAQYGNVGGANVLGDATGDVAKFRNNVLSSANHVFSSNVANSVSPADGLIATGFIPLNLMQKAKTVDGLGTTTANPNYDADRAATFLGDVGLTSKFAIGGQVNLGQAGGSPVNVTSGSGAFYAIAAMSGSNRIAVTDTNGDGVKGNYLFGNFNQNGTRDFAGLQAAQAAQAALAASGLGTDMTVGANNFAKVSGLAAPLATMQGQVGAYSAGNAVTTTGASKGDLIVLGDFNGDGKFDGKDLYLYAAGAALADGTGTASLTPTGGETLGDAIRRGVLRKNAALDWLQTNATAQQKLDATANAANDPAGANAFNKFDVNRDGLVSRNDAAIVDKFVGADKTSLAQQLLATVNADGSANAGGTQVPVSLYQVGLIDGQNVIAAGRYTLSGSAGNPTVTVTSAGDFALVRQALGGHLQAGDTKFRGQVDSTDVNQIVQRGHYNDGTSNNRWSDGDFTGDGVVNSQDVNAIVQAGFYNKGNYDAATSAQSSSATKTLTGRAVSPASSTAGTPGDGQPDFQYDPATGDVLFVRDGLDTSKLIQTLTLRSAGNKFVTGVGYTSNNNSGVDVDQADEQFASRFSGIAKAAPFTFDLGDILPTNLSPSALQSDLSVFYDYQGDGASGDGIPAGVTVLGASTPEPAALSVVALGAGALLARRHRRKAK